MDLKSKKVNELKILCKQFNITGYSKLKKKELIHILEYLVFHNL